MDWIYIIRTVDDSVFTTGIHRNITQEGMERLLEISVRGAKLPSTYELVSIGLPTMIMYNDLRDLVLERGFDLEDFDKFAIHQTTERGKSITRFFGVKRDPDSN